MTVSDPAVGDETAWNEHTFGAGRSTVFERDAVVAAVDLVALADELLGRYRGMWPCPNPRHSQTGRTPPVSVFDAYWGEQRWHCHGCGNGGSAIDLVMQVLGLRFDQALAHLARVSGVAPLPRGAHPAHRRRRRGRPRDRPEITPLAPRPIPALERYVEECATMLWTSEGAPIRRWLTTAPGPGQRGDPSRPRGLPLDVLKTSRVGADLGARRQLRPAGIANVRRAVVLPVLIDPGAVCYVQLRLPNPGPDVPRYLFPKTSLAPNPRVGLYRPASQLDFPFQPREIIVTEGIIDALAAAAGGYTAAAVLGAGYADPRTAMLLARLDRPLVIAFDPDPPGRAATELLCRLLRRHRLDPSVLNLRSGDLNDHLVRAKDWPVELAGRVEHATHPRAPALSHRAG